VSFPLRLGEGVDLTQTLANGMTVYVGDPVPSMKRYKTLEKNGVNLTLLTLGSHTGTHVDAPIHFVKGGKAVDQLPAEQFVGEGVVLDLSSKPPGSGIAAADLEGYSDQVAEGTIVLIYTGFSKRWSDPRARRKFTYIEGSGAEWLVRKKVKAVGIDYLSVEKFGAKKPVAHTTLLSSGITIIESLNENLAKLLGRRVLFVCLPIKLAGGDGAPSRALAYPIAGGP
jgi:arylformamidase